MKPITAPTLDRSRVIAAILAVAVLAFELFNFDTTRFALGSLLGSQATFGPLPWATVLAVAFCGLDFAGLLRVFGGDEHGKPINYLLGAWLLGATMNAVLTWHAVVLTLGTHDASTAVLTQQQLLNTVPIFVAVMVWLTRILLIAALSLSAAILLQPADAPQPQPARMPLREPRPPASADDEPTLVVTPPTSAARRAAQSATPLRHSATLRPTHGRAGGRP